MTIEEFLQLIWPIAQDVLPYIGTLITAVASFLCFRISAKEHKEKEKVLTEALERSKSNETYTICPKCGAKTPLSQVNFYLPGDIRDNNLNGIPDDNE